MSEPLIELDGSFGEGGGQILRTSLALSLLTGRPFHLGNVRARRPRPGLQPQHLMSVKAAATIGQAELRGATKGSTDLSFCPGVVVPGTHHFAIGTAGATGLVLHTLYLPLALASAPSAGTPAGTPLAGAPSDLTIDGGTHVSTSPCFHFLETTWRGYMELLGLEIDLKMRRPGFYPRGGGLLQAHIEPCPRLKGIELSHLERPTRIRGISAVAGLPEHIARRQAERANKELQSLDLTVDIREETWSGGPGTVLALTLNTRPVPTLFFALGERGKPAERVGHEAAAQVVRFLDSEPLGIDEHSADQILLPLALAAGSSLISVANITPHLATNAAVIGRFIDRRIDIDGDEGGPGTLRVAG
jgi:RNA 3'-terminal phosphate cyclase (ATP)